MHICNIVRHLVLLAWIASLIPVFAFAQDTQGDRMLEVPETLDEAKEESIKVGNKIASALPTIVENLWNTRVTPVWSNMWNWTQTTLWEQKMQPIVQNLTDWAKQLIGREVEQKRPIIEQALQEEKQELAQDVRTYGKAIGKGLWERFLDLFQKN